MAKEAEFRHGDYPVVGMTDPKLSDPELRHGECLVLGAASAIKAGHPELAQPLLDEFDSHPRLVANTVTRTMRAGVQSISKPKVPAPPMPLTRSESSVLRFLQLRHPEPVTLDDIADPNTADVARDTAATACKGLIGKRMAERPHGPRGGIVATDFGMAVFNPKPK